MNNDIKTKFNELTKLIIKYKQIIILRHVMPDGDCLGSSFGLAGFIKLNWPSKKVFTLSNNNQDFNISNLKHLFPENDTLENIDYKNTLCLIVDTSTQERIATDLDLSKFKDVVKIDHHPNLEVFETLTIQDTKYSSACELVSEYIFSNKKHKINDEIAKYLYVGIVTDTNRFLYDATTSNTLAIASKLLNYKINFNEIFSILQYREDNIVRLQAEVIKSSKISNGVSWFLMTSKLYKKYGVTFEEASSLVNTLLQFKSVKYAIYGAFDKEKNNYKVSLRSKEKPINQIAEHFGGGGHAKASGIRLKNKKEFNQALEMLKNL